VADQDHLVAARRVLLRLQVDLRHERARRVDHAQAPPPRGRDDLVGDAVRAEDRHRALGHRGEVVDEDHAARGQVVDDVAVVDDLVEHVHRRAVQLERALDDLDRAVDARAEPARVGEAHLHVSGLP
jgi:hypothetical protein